MKDLLKELVAFTLVFWCGITAFILTMRYAEWFFGLVFGG